MCSGFFPKKNVFLYLINVCFLSQCFLYHICWTCLSQNCCCYYIPLTWSPGRLTLCHLSIYTDIGFVNILNMLTSSLKTSFAPFVFFPQPFPPQLQSSNPAPAGWETVLERLDLVSPPISCLHWVAGVR